MRYREFYILAAKLLDASAVSQSPFRESTRRAKGLRFERGGSFEKWEWVLPLSAGWVRHIEDQRHQ
jgi:hypothetical protein